MSLFDPTPARMAELVVAANQRAERIAQRLMAAERYANRKGDLELARLLAVPAEDSPASASSEQPKGAGRGSQGR